MNDSDSPSQRPMHAATLDHAARVELFVQRLTEHQSRIHAYVYSLVGDRSRAMDVVQETNLVLWRRFDDYDLQRPFLPWALAIARRQVLAHIRDRKRDRLLLDETLAEQLSVEAEQQAAHYEALRDALRRCVAMLPPASREFLNGRYQLGLSLADLASRAQRTVGAVKVAMLRIRRRLEACVRDRLVSETHHG